MRVAEDGKTGHLPPSPGTLPLFEVEGYGGKLPEAVTMKSGFFNAHVSRAQPCNLSA